MRKQLHPEGYEQRTEVRVVRTWKLERRAWGAETLPAGEGVMASETPSSQKLGASRAEPQLIPRRCKTPIKKKIKQNK